MSDDAELQPLVAGEYGALADQLGSMTAARWDTPSLCSGWRVREVVAHVTMAARYPEEMFMAELRDCDFDFTRLSDRIAARDGTGRLPTSELVADLRADVMRHWTPPGGGYHGALSHVVIHGLDATVPLGVPRRGPERSIRVVLDGLSQAGSPNVFGVDIEGRQLRATDLDWSYGSGEPLWGTAADIVLAMSGRAVPKRRLDGTPLRRVASPEPPA